mgnify:CR=1 FL=1
MRLLIIGTLEGHLTEASQIALKRGAKVQTVDAIDDGLDLLRAPLNVVLAPIHALTRLFALIARLLRARRPPVEVATMTRYRADFPCAVAYPPNRIHGTLGETASNENPRSTFEISTMSGTNRRRPAPLSRSGVVFFPPSEPTHLTALKMPSPL